MSMATLNEFKQEVFDYVRYSLGDGMVDVELDRQHYEQALKAAILRYRQRSSNSVEESYAFLDIMGLSAASGPKKTLSEEEIDRILSEHQIDLTQDDERAALHMVLSTAPAACSPAITAPSNQPACSGA